MAENRMLPPGFIDRINEDGAIIKLTRPSDSRTLQPGTPEGWPRSRADSPIGCYNADARAEAD